jgi:hypothetical protein
VTGAERARFGRSESPFFLLAVPVPFVGILTLLGSSLSASIRWVVVLGAVALGYWGGGGGRRSGMTGRRLVLAVAAGAGHRRLVLALDVLLQPGQAASGTVG